jgi:hypothetical protein
MSRNLSGAPDRFGDSFPNNLFSTEVLDRV